MSPTSPHDNLIARLGEDLVPVTPLRSPVVRAAQMTVAGLVWAGLILWMLGARAPLESSLLLVYYAVEIALLCTLLWLSALAAFQSAVPGERAGRTIRIVLGAAGAWLLLLAGGAAFGIAPAAPLEGAECGWNIALAAAAPAAALAFALSGGMVLEKRLAGLSVALCAAISGVLGVEAHCRWESPLHHVVFHLLPVLVIASAGFLLAPPIAARARRR